MLYTTDLQRYDIVNRMPSPEIWPQFQADTYLRHAFAELDVNLPQVAQHLNDRGVEEEVISNHTLSLSTNRKAAGYYEPQGRYWYERAWIDLYPEAALKIALGRHIGKSVETGDWSQSLALEEPTKQLLDEWTTHELQHVVDFNEPGAWEANKNYARGTNRMLRRHMYGTAAALGGGFTGALNVGIDTLFHLNPQTSPILMSLGMLAAGVMTWGAVSRHTEVFGTALREVRYNNNPFERSANTAEDIETGNFFTVALTTDVDAWAQYSIENYRRYILRA